VLVVGVDVLSQLARCCRPVPPDSILGFVTRGRGITVHRADCQSFAQLVKRVPERVLEAAWDSRHLETQRRFPLDLLLRANDRPGLLRDVSDVLARDRINVTALQTQTRGEIASMRFTVEVSGREQAQSAMNALRGVSGVVEVGRRI
jgi:GTP pyrophosphokinase